MNLQFYFVGTVENLELGDVQFLTMTMPEHSKLFPSTSSVHRINAGKIRGNKKAEHYCIICKVKLSDFIGGRVIISV